MAPVLFSCGHALEDGMKVVLKFPSVLSRNTTRFYRFLGRSDYLVIKIREKEYKFEASQYEKIKISDFSFEGENVVVSAEFWDKIDGKTRPFPVLSGTQKISLKELKKNKTAEVEIPLTLHVSVTEFDKS